MQSYDKRKGKNSQFTKKNQGSKMMANRAPIQDNSNRK